MLPGVTSLALRGCMKGAGSVFSSRSTALRATVLRSPPEPWTAGGTMSSRVTGMPALAKWAAMPAPMTPAPITAACLISGVVMIAGASSSDRFQHRGDALAAADALGGQGEPPALAPQQRRRLAGDPRAGGAQRMAQRQRAAVEID